MSLSERDISALCKFMIEYLSQQVEEVGKFSVEDLQLSTHENLKEIKFNSKLAPYEHGVRQNVKIVMKKDVIKNRWDAHIILQKTSGETSVWIRLVRGFVDEIRKQFLLWRTMSSKEKRRYMQE